MVVDAAKLSSERPEGYGLQGRPFLVCRRTQKYVNPYKHIDHPPRSYYMRPNILPILALMMLLLSCSDEEPTCISELISNFQSNQSGCSGATVIRYEFEGSEVYAFTDGSCINDGGTQIWDEECQSVCFLGGIAGFTMCGDVDFFGEAVELEEIFREN